MTKHSPEPWRIGADAGFQLIQILSAEGFQTCVGEQSCGIDDARRIVACVNACFGIDTEQLEQLPTFTLRRALHTMMNGKP